MIVLSRLILVLSLVLVVAASPASAQATLTGIVTNSATGAVLEGARVQLKGSALETTTDNLGTYRFQGLPAGEAVLLVTYTGLSPAEAAATLGAAGTVRRDVGLTAEIYRMSRFVVGSEREGNAKAITLQRLSDGVKNVVSADAFGALAGNPADLAARLPGIEGESVGGDNRYLRIRGLSQNLSTITRTVTASPTPARPAPPASFSSRPSAPTRSSASRSPNPRRPIWTATRSAGPSTSSRRALSTAPPSGASAVPLARSGARATPGTARAPAPRSPTPRCSAAASACP
jgi:hypothetical protein